MPSEKITLWVPRRTYFAPAETRLPAGLGGGAGYRPRVRKTYFDANLSP
jgi:hypothetical protein